jgi:sensor histidine kinase YesM
VRASVRDGNWRIEVSDDGIGFDPDALSRLRAQIDAWSRTGDFPPLRIDGMGLLNIAMRLRMLYGEDYVFDMAGESPRGARVTIGGKVDVR